MSRIVKNMTGGGTTKRYSMARLTAALLTLVLLSVIVPPTAFAAPAADNAKIESMNIRIQSEYDDPRVLAVLEPVLSADTKLPMKAKFLISKKITDIQINMACEIPEGQGHRCKVYNTTDVGNNNELSYSVDSARNLFLEYYWNPFKDVKDGKKNFVYEFTSPYAIKKLNVQIMEGKKASGFKIEPVSNDKSKDQEGFTWHNYTFNDVTPGQILTFNVDYTKTDAQPEIQKAVAPPVNEKTPGVDAGNRSGVQLMLFFFVILIVVGILAVYWRSKVVTETAQSSRPVARPKPKGAKVSKTPIKTSAQAKYCGNCGSETSAGNKFCSECGSEVA